jgi:FAD/FMN-containing dehydrogenase
MPMSLESLKETVRGPVITADDAEYDEARKVYNAMIDRRPRVVVRPANTGDVMTAIRFAAENGLPVATRGGAHSVPGFGTADDAVVVDLSGMRGVRVDPHTHHARVEGGATWGDFNAATYPYGLATTGGIISTTGVAGLTLGGGIGHLSRGLGLSCDNLVSADVVTADGTVHVASEKENDELFWALRGGSGNFGVVTSFEFQLHPVKDVYGGPMFFELEHARSILEFHREYIKDAPEEMGVFPAFHLAPPLPFIPEERVGTPFILLVGCWAGSPGDGERMMQPFHDVAPVFAEGVGPMPYPALNSAFDGLHPPGMQNYWKANFLRELTDDAISAHLSNAPNLPAINSAVHLYPINGACHRVTPAATAFGHRDATYATVIVGEWPDAADNDANIAWVRGYYDAISPHGEEGGYVNFMSEDDADKAPANYGSNYERLAQVKRTYDPDNLFRINQNIKPT